MIPLSKLELSPVNVRKTTSKTADEELMASIVAHGLINPLTVTEQKGGKYHVVAGGRRLKALQALDKAKKLPEALQESIPCRLTANDDVAEVSLAENVVRQAMHPADEFEAFKQLVDADTPIADVALRFGVSERHVQGRLAMARLDKKVLKAFRDGEIKLEHVMAFTVTDDKKKQLEVLEDISPEYDDGDDIRRALMSDKVKGDDHVAKFVGKAAYEKAGGKTRSDLFGDDVFFEDAALLSKLAREKLQNVANSLAGDGWGWVEIVDDIYEHSRHMTRIYDKNPKKAEKALLGCLVSVGNDAKHRIENNLLRKADAAAYKALSPKAAEQQSIKGGKEPGSMPDSLLRALEAFRLQVAEVAIASKPELAYDLLVFRAAVGAFVRFNVETGVDIPFRSHRPFMGDVKGTEAAQSLDKIRAGLPLAWLGEVDEEGDIDIDFGDIGGEQFSAFQKLTASEKADILAYCVALTLQPALAPQGDDDTDARDVALSQTGTRVMDYWRPTVANYLGRITTAQLLEIGTEIFGKPWAEGRKSAKKGDLAKTLEDAFAKPEKAAGGNETIIVKLLQWLPKGMEFTQPANDKSKKPAKPRKAA